MTLTCLSCDYLRCLSGEGVVEQCGEKVVHHLVVCIFKVSVVLETR